MNAKVFINYRREDTAPYVGRLYDRLSERFGKNQVFIDIDQIEYGEDFVEAINRKVGTCDIAIVAIGRNWLRAIDASGKRRIDGEQDFVRMEIIAALQRKIRVYPVLFGRAEMPRSQDLPEALAPLSRLNAIELSDAHFHADVSRLIESIEKFLAVAEKQAEASATPAAPPPEPAKVLREASGSAAAVAERTAGERVEVEAARLTEEGHQTAAQRAEAEATRLADKKRTLKEAAKAAEAKRKAAKAAKSARLTYEQRRRRDSWERKKTTKPMQLPKVRDSDSISARPTSMSPSTEAGEFVREEMEHIREGEHGTRLISRTDGSALLASEESSESQHPRISRTALKVMAYAVYMTSIAVGSLCALFTERVTDSRVALVAAAGISAIVWIGLWTVVFPSLRTEIREIFWPSER